ncbi:cytochrome P450 [Streptomyces sp. NPDC053048]|uniref:cytochrome P450 n=1 Tax=Streptomyces sp. NPDC053048 TaxID=3365694 RepID=UPI0037D4CC1F
MTSAGYTLSRAPGARPLLGHVPALFRDPLPFLRSLAGLGDLVELRLGPRPAFLVCSPELFHDVLTDTRHFDKGGPFFDKLRRFTGDGLGTTPHEVHRRQRRQLQAAFRPDYLSRYLEVMREEITALTARWTDGAAVEVEEEAYALIARIIARTMFSADGASQDVARIAASYPDFHHGLGRHMRSPFALLDRLPTPANRRFRRACSTLGQVVDDAIAARRRGETAPQQDLLSLMTDEGMADAEIRDHVLTMLTGGIATSASILGWALFFLSRDRESAEAVCAEARAALSRRVRLDGDRPVHFDLTHRVVLETLRFHPSAWFFSRAVVAPVELAGRRLAPGTAILLSPYVIHHRPDLYPEPERFDADRWSPARRAEVPRNAYIPFGAGSRQCIGDVYALTELTLAVAIVMSQWRLDLPEGPTPHHLLAPRPWTVIHPFPLRLRPHRRP